MEFTYPALPVGVDAIRILTLGPGEFADPVDCQLASVTFSAKPVFVALSYTWGDPYPDNVTLPTHSSEYLSMASPQTSEHLLSTVPDDPSAGTMLHKQDSDSLRLSRDHLGPDLIRLNGLPFRIEHNLYLALLHVRSLTHSLALWIDSICINQADIPERNSQVAMMSTIYTRAVQVVAWLGLKEYRKRIDLFRNMASDWKAGQGHLFAGAISNSTVPHCSLEPDLRLLARLAESGYWSRVWIVQEVCLARNLVFMYGSKIWTWEALQSWRGLAAVRTRPGSLTSVSETEGDVFDSMLQRFNTRDERFTEAMRLEVLVERFAQSACSELRDRIYGLLGLANDIHPYSKPRSAATSTTHLTHSPISDQEGTSYEHHMFQVDYSRSFYDIWKDVVQFFNAQVEARTPAHCKGESFQQQRQMTIVRAAAIVQEALGQRVLRDDDASDLVRNTMFIEQPTIHVIGFLRSHVIHIGPSYTKLIAKASAQRNWYLSWNRFYHGADLAIIREKEKDYMSRLLRLSDEDLKMVQDLDSPSTVAQQLDKGSGAPKMAHSTPPMTTTSVDIKAQVSDESSICLGSEHTITLVPPSSRVGDVIVQFWDCDAAIVMRPCNPTNLGDDGSLIYTLVGRADLIRNRLKSTTSRSKAADRELTTQKTTSRISIQMNYRTLQMITAAVPLVAE